MLITKVLLTFFNLQTKILYDKINLEVKNYGIKRK